MVVVVVGGEAGRWNTTVIRRAADPLPSRGIEGRRKEEEEEKKEKRRGEGGRG